MILSPFSFLYGMRSKKREKNAFWYVEFFFFCENSGLHQDVLSHFKDL